MKNYFATTLLLCMIFLVSGCGKSFSDNESEQIELTADKVITKANVACNSATPQQSLGWLNNIIKKAEEDRLTKKHMGNYIGRIFLTSYRSQPVFHITMSLETGGGGIYAFIYDCFGNSVTIAERDVTGFEQQVQKGTLIYSNLP